MNLTSYIKLINQVTSDLRYAHAHVIHPLTQVDNILAIELPEPTTSYIPGIYPDMLVGVTREDFKVFRVALKALNRALYALKGSMNTLRLMTGESRIAPYTAQLNRYVEYVNELNEVSSVRN